MESHWNETKILQTIGRAIRKGSHNDLPLDERHVEIYRYSMKIVDKRQSQLLMDEIEFVCPSSRNCTCAPDGTIFTTDQFIYNCSKRKQVRIDQTLRLLQRMAVDCSPNFDMNSDLYEIYQNIKNNLTNFDQKIEITDIKIKRILFKIENSELNYLDKEQFSIHLILIYLLVVYNDSNSFPSGLMSKLKNYMDRSLYLSDDEKKLQLPENRTILIIKIKTILLNKLHNMIEKIRSNCYKN